MVMRESVWRYMPPRHKTQYLGHERIVFFGPRAQAIVRPFLGGAPNRYLFSPTDAEQERLKQLHTQRRTPLSCDNRPGTNVNPSDTRTSSATPPVRTFVANTGSNRPR